MKLALYILYRYYGSSGRYTDIAFEQAAMILLCVLWFNFLTLVSLVHLDWVMPKMLPEHYWRDRIMFFVLASVAYLIFTRIYKKEIITGEKYDEEALRYGKVKVVAYLVGSLVCLVIVALLKTQAK